MKPISLFKGKEEKMSHTPKNEKYHGCKFTFSIVVTITIQNTIINIKNYQNEKTNNFNCRLMSCLDNPDTGTEQKTGADKRHICQNGPKNNVRETYNR